MPVSPTYPGVYIEELPSGVRTITGVSTSVAAFIGFFRKGPMDKAVQIFSMADFERMYGGLDSQSEASYAVQQFFLNGGQVAWIVRTAGGGKGKADVELLNKIDGVTATTVLTVEAISEGGWGNSLRINIDSNTSDPATLFNLTVLEYASGNGSMQVARSEVFRELSMVNVETVVNDETSGSKMIRVTLADPLPDPSLPVACGTFSSHHMTDSVNLTSLSPQVQVTIGPGDASDVTHTASLAFPTGTVPGSVKLKTITPALESAIRAADPSNPVFAEAKVDLIRWKNASNADVRMLRVLAGPGNPHNLVTFASLSPSDTTAGQLGLTTSAVGRPATLSDDHGGVDPTISDSNPEMTVTIGEDSGIADFAVSGGETLAQLAPIIQDAIRDANTANSFTGALVSVANGYLIVIPGGTGNDHVEFSETDDDSTTVGQLKLSSTVVTELTATCSGKLTSDPGFTESDRKVDILVGTTLHEDVVLDFSLLNSWPGEYDDVLQGAIRALGGTNLYNKALVAIATENTTDHYIIVVPGEDSDKRIIFGNADEDNTATELLLTSTINLQEYTLGETGPISDTAQGAGTPGNDGSLPGATELIGEEGNKTGMYALEDVDIFNILCIPSAAMLTDTFTVNSTAITYCARKRAFYIMDAPEGVNDVPGIKDWLDDNATLRNKNAAFYFPRIKVADPLNEYRLRSFGASGTIAGLYARTDNNRGVWKAPAGTEAALVNVQSLDYLLTDNENGALNPLAINCLRNFAIYGNVCWGGRTLEGADQMASEWKYIPIRRLALYIEESLFRGTKWVVFEPNDEPLWSQIRLNVGAFMHRLFRQGAFQGGTPKEAYFVKCDKETTTQEDINLGIVNIIVGFAPLKPAEFVIIKIQQIASQD